MDNEAADFWTILLSDIRISGGLITIKGHFVYVTIVVIDREKRMKMLWLTPEDKPFEFELPKPLFPKKRLEEISARDVEERFRELFENMPVSAIPEAPLRVPVEKLPPSKRRKVIHAAKKARENRIRGRQ